MPAMMCPCCECNGKMCFVDHPGHNHRSSFLEGVDMSWGERAIIAELREELKTLKEQFKLLEEAYEKLEDKYLDAIDNLDAVYDRDS